MQIEKNQTLAALGYRRAHEMLLFRIKEIRLLLFPLFPLKMIDDPRIAMKRTVLQTCNHDKWIENQQTVALTLIQDVFIELWQSAPNEVRCN